MKFKKIEISAFRIFDNPQDATFDFSNKDGAIADFVSLYAPNGFGKTSFYDAVEWGITNNIQRFWQNESVMGKSIEALKEIGPKSIKLWRHTNSSNPTYVRIETDQQEEPQYRELKVHGNTRIDASNENIENKDFRTVILSQEWISAFLREVNGEQRYKIFMENPDLVNIDNYYKSIKTLVNVCSDRIVAVGREIETLKSQIVEMEEGNLLETINSTISLLKQLGENISLITLSMSKEEVLAFKNFISDKLVSKNTQNSLLDILNHINTVKVGNDTIQSIERYYDIPEALDKAKTELEEIKGFISLFQQKDLLSTEKETNLKERTAAQEEIDNYDNLLRVFPEFNRANSSIQAKLDDTSQLERRIVQLNKDLEVLKREEIQGNAKIISLAGEIENTNSLLSKIPALVERLANANNEIKALEEKRSVLIKEVNERAKTISDSQAKLAELRRLKSTVEQNKFNLLKTDDVGENSQLLEQIIENIKNIQQKSPLLSELDSNIKESQTLNDSIQEFIKKGLDIVNSTQATNCPLCEQEYSSYSELADKISGNKALNATLQILFGRRKEISDTITATNQSIDAGKKSLLDFFSRLIEKELSTLNELERNGQALVSGQKLVDAELARQQKIINDANEELGNQAIENYKKELDNKNETDKKLLEGERADYEKIKDRISNLANDIIISNEQLSLILSEIDNLRNESNYKLVFEWFLNSYPGEAILENKVLELKATLLVNSERLKEKHNQITIELQELQSKLELKSEKALTEQKNEFQVLIDRNLDTQRKFEYYLKSSLNIDIALLKREDLESLLTVREKETRLKLDADSKVKAEYERLEKYTVNLLPYIQTENVKDKIQFNEELLTYLTGTVNVALESERDKTREYLEKQVSEFFYISLINSLYSKIDPHPNFKSVDFRVNFDSDNPRLDIYVINSEREELLIPNLYFSTAQINILSLSIFLASALNSNMYECIFIDDPIQSLDSINILSTIDLIRSIVINQNRQVILSTHDENFHNLLKKKMPPALFKSKFLELETFGKVKK